MSSQGIASPFDLPCLDPTSVDVRYGGSWLAELLVQKPLQESKRYQLFEFQLSHQPLGYSSHTLHAFLYVSILLVS